MQEIDLPKSVGIISQGVDYIADGRIFFIATSSVAEFKPPTLTRFMPIYRNIPVEVMGLVNDNISLACQECDEIYRRILFLHTEDWMFTGLSCINHPVRALLDIFPKTSPETSYEWFNAFLGFGVYVSLPEGVVIEPQPQSDDYTFYLNLKRKIKPTYLLTQSGLRKMN